MEKGTCKHFNGLRGSDKRKCDAGICYRDHVGGDDFGWATRLPCHRIQIGRIKPNSPVNPCDKYEEPSDEEVAAFEAEVEKASERMMKTIPIISAMKKRHKKGNGWESAIEIVECPICKGKLTMTISEVNGHVWGACETKDCVSWME